MYRITVVLLAFFVSTAAVISMAIVDRAQAGVVAKINLSSQTMNVYVDGAIRYSWQISSGRRGFNTPRGSYRPGIMKRMHYSRKYNNSPMPHSIFFRGGYAIHGTNYISQLGGTASHGCVRLHPSNAATLYTLIRRRGKNQTRIVINGTARHGAIKRVSKRRILRKKRITKARTATRGTYRYKKRRSYARYANSHTSHRAR